MGKRQKRRPKRPGGYARPARRTDFQDADLYDKFDLVVDQDAEPFDLDQFLDALDRLVERRLISPVRQCLGFDRP